MAPNRKIFALKRIRLTVSVCSFGCGESSYDGLPCRGKGEGCMDWGVLRFCCAKVSPTNHQFSPRGTGPRLRGGGRLHRRDHAAQLPAWQVQHHPAHRCRGELGGRREAVASSVAQAQGERDGSGPVPAAWQGRADIQLCIRPFSTLLSSRSKVGNPPQPSHFPPPVFQRCTGPRA